MSLTEEVLAHNTPTIPDEALLIVPGVSDEVAAAAYLTMKRQNLLPIVWHEGIPDLVWFLEWCRNPANVIYGCYVHKPSGEVDLAGLGWAVTKTKVANGWKYEIGHVFFREFQSMDSNLPLRFCRLMVDYSFQNLKALVLCGSTPTKNFAAVRFIERAGFTIGCTIPNYTVWKGEPCAAVISYLTRETWEANRGSA